MFFRAAPKKSKNFKIFIFGKTFENFGFADESHIFRSFLNTATRKTCKLNFRPQILAEFSQKPLSISCSDNFFCVLLPDEKNEKILKIFTKIKNFLKSAKCEEIFFQNEKIFKYSVKVEAEKVFATNFTVTLLGPSILQAGKNYSFLSGSLGGGFGHKKNTFDDFSDLEISLKIKNFHTKSRHALIVSENLDVFGFGSNLQGRLGLGRPSGDFLGPTNLEFFNFSIFRKGNVVKVFTGPRTSACLTDAGTVYTWGCNRDIQLGFFSDEMFVPYPQEVRYFTKTHVKIKNVSMGKNHSCFLSSQGVLYVSGFNKFADPAPLTLPDEFGGLQIDEMTSGDDFTILKNSRGEIFRVGIFMDQLILTPEKFEEFDDQKILQISSNGLNHMAVGFGD